MKAKGKRPESIKLFERLFLLNTVLSAVAVLLNYDALRSHALKHHSAAATPLIGLAANFIIDIPLWYFIARRASPIAKWLLIVFYVLGYLGLAIDLGKLREYPVSYRTLLAIATILSFSAMAMLFRRDATAWLRSRGRVGPVDPEIFK